MRHVRSRDVEIAIFWDFENIHASLIDEKFGQSAYKRGAGRGESIVEINPVMQFVASLGDVAINRAYANWGPLSSYRHQVLDHSIDLVQLYPRGMNAKNGADIRIVLDAMEATHHFPHISHVIIIGGDSDYVGLAQKLRQSGKHVVGIGVQGSTNSYWLRACNEFKFYRTLLAKTAENRERELVDLKGGSDLTSFKGLIRQALRGAEDRVHMATVGMTLRRLDSTFDPANFGFATLTDLLNQCSDVVEVARGEHDMHVTLKRVQLPTSVLQTPPPRPPASSNLNVDEYRRILARNNLFIPDPTWRREALNALADALGVAKTLPSWADVERTVAEELKRKSFDDNMETIQKFRLLCWNARIFVIAQNRRDIGIRTDSAGMNDAIDAMILSNLLREMGPPLDRNALAEIIAADKRNLSPEISLRLSKMEQALQSQESEVAEVALPDANNGG